MRNARAVLALSLVAALVASDCGGGGTSTTPRSQRHEARRLQTRSTFRQITQRLRSRYPASHFTGRLRPTVLTLHADGAAYQVKRDSDPAQAKLVVRTLNPPHAKNPPLIVRRGRYTVAIPIHGGRLAKARDLTPAQLRDFRRVVAQL